MKTYCSYCGNKLPCSRVECTREWIKDDLEGSVAVIVGGLAERVAELERKLEAKDYSEMVIAKRIIALEEKLEPKPNMLRATGIDFADLERNLKIKPDMLRATGIDLDKIRPGMSVEELAKVSEEIARVAKRSTEQS
jgi:hypothetical protein